MASSSTNSSLYKSPCAACKFLRRKCIPDCIFAVYFPPEEPKKFANVHKIFGASNVTKLLNELLPDQREDAVNSLSYEAEARIKDPVYGCVGAISFLTSQVHRLQKELDAANAHLLRFACSEFPPPAANLPLDPSTAVTSSLSPFISPTRQSQQQSLHYTIPRRIGGNEEGGGGGGGRVNYQQSPPNAFSFPYNSLPWNIDYPYGDHNSGGGGGVSF